jgi:hypothetical protein
MARRRPRLHTRQVPPGVTGPPPVPGFFGLALKVVELLLGDVSLDRADVPGLTLKAP